MSTIKAANIQNPSAASAAIVLDTSGNVNIDSNTLYVDGTNNRVGIGTSSVNYEQLTVQSASADVVAKFAGPTDPATWIQFTDNTTTDQAVMIGCIGNDLRLRAGSQERVRIDSSGRLLVGTSSTSVDCEMIIQGAAGSGYYSNVLIAANTATPTTSDPDFGQIRFTDNTHTTAASIIGARDGGTWSSTSKPSRLVFSTTADGASSPTDRMRITKDGNVLIGTTSLISAERLAVTKGSGTALTLNVFNSAATLTSKNANPIVRLASQGSGADCCVQVTDSVSHNYYFGGNNGGAYVVTNSNGVRLSNGGTSWASDSDERVKDIIEPITAGLDKVSTLRAVIGKYKTDDEDKRRSFLIAQDVQAVLPEAVYDEQGTLMLAYTDTIPLLVAALKESKERIEQLEAKVTALETP